MLDKFTKKFIIFRKINLIKYLKKMLKVKSTNLRHVQSTKKLRNY